MLQQYDELLNKCNVTTFRHLPAIIVYLAQMQQIVGSTQQVDDLCTFNSEDVYVMMCCHRTSGVQPY